MTRVFFKAPPPVLSHKNHSNFKGGLWQDERLTVWSETASGLRKIITVSKMIYLVMTYVTYILQVIMIK